MIALHRDVSCLILLFAEAGVRAASACARPRSQGQHLRPCGRCPPCLRRWSVQVRLVSSISLTITISRRLAGVLRCRASPHPHDVAVEVPDLGALALGEILGAVEENWFGIAGGGASTMPRMASSVLRSQLSPPPRIRRRCHFLRPRRHQLRASGHRGGRGKLRGWRERRVVAAFTISLLQRSPMTLSEISVPMLA